MRHTHPRTGLVGQHSGPEPVVQGVSVFRWKIFPGRQDATVPGRTLGDETRLSLLATLSTGAECSIARLSEDSPLTRQAITKHLQVLESAGLVRGYKQGREQMWELNARQIEEARRCLDIIAREWDSALERLKKFIEE